MFVREVNVFRSECNAEMYVRVSQTDDYVISNVKYVNPILALLRRFFIMKKIECEHSLCVVCR